MAQGKVQTVEKAKIIRSVSVVGLFTMSSRVLGLARDVLMAGLFGTSVWMSAFVVAFTIPNLFRRLFGEGALAASFIPVFVETRQKQGDPAAWDMARKVITMLAAVLTLLVLSGIIIISGVIAFSAPGGKAAIILPLLRIMLPYMIFICLAALSMAILNSFQHFAVPAATPCLLNFIWILTVLLVCPRLGSSMNVRIHAVAWAVLVAGIVQLGAQVPMLRHFGFRAGLSFAWRDTRIIRMLQLMGPAALGLAVTQFNVLIDRMLAAWIGAWAPAALFYSERLIYFPLGVFATAMGTVLLPTFSGHAARTDASEMKRTINHSLCNLLFVMIPAAAGLLVLAHPIIRMIFEWKLFTAQSTHLTAIALQFYAPGLLVFSLARILVPAFYAQQDTITPVKVGILTVVLNLVLNLAFVLTWPLYLKHAGLACATVLAESFYALVLAILLHRRLGSPGWRKIGGSAIRSAIAAMAMGIAVWFIARYLPTYLPQRLPNKIAQIITVAIAIGFGTGFYLSLAFLLRIPALTDIFHSLVNSKSR